MAYDSARFVAVTPRTETFYARGNSIMFLPQPVAPTLAFSPAAGTALDALQSVQLDVTVGSGEVSSAIIFARYPSSAVIEVIFDGQTFATGYSASSFVALTGGGYRFTLRRNVGWPDDPQFYVRAISSTGGVN